MMEVKQNTTVELNDLLTSTKNGGNERVDAVMADLVERTQDLVNCDLIKAKDKPENIAELRNGDVAIESVISNVDVGKNLDASVNSELEDALLAEDDVLPKVTSKGAESLSTTDDDLLADKVETSNSTTSSNIVRDPGDDLDTLLSKINDIVEDCIDNGIENTVNTEREEKTKNVEENKQDNLNPKETFRKESNECSLKTEEKLLDINEKKQVEKELNVSKKKENEINYKSGKLSSVLSVSESETFNNTNSNSKKDTEVTLSPNCTSKTLEPNANYKHKIIHTTDDSKIEAVQDSEITSNSKESLEFKEASEHCINKSLQNKSQETAEIIGVPHRDKDFLARENKTKVQKEDIRRNVENEDSDDEIVFYVDNPPEKSKEYETTISSTLTAATTVTTASTTILPTIETITTTTKMATTTAELESEATENEKSQKETHTVKKSLEDDDDVVLLLDDDDDDVGQHKKDVQRDVLSIEDQKELEKSEYDKISGDSNMISEEKNIDLDNSDNARDDFVAEKVIDEKMCDKSNVAVTPEETNSNCSSSSNLLQEAKSIENTLDEPMPEEVENEEDDDDGDIELIENELKESDISEKVEESELSPPAKRLRLSEDSEISLKTGDEIKEAETINMATNRTESQEKLEEEKPSDPTASSLKRTHDIIEVEGDEKSSDSTITNEGVNKKPRIADVKPSDNVVEVKEDKHSEDSNGIADVKTNIKAVPSYQPIPLYPAPKLEVLKSESTLSLDFLKKYRKSFDNMTKQDLEELVLQKVVEAIIHRSEFSEMRELVEKQEKLITAHRAKISELSKQFRDLEMVHNRVVKDIEQRNSQFIMPVKITRAVGLQVYIPNKKSLVDTGSNSSNIAQNLPPSPQRPVASQASSSSQPLTPPQRPFLPLQTDIQQRPGNTLPPVPGSAGSIRRGCVQKITPTRPVPGTNQPSSAVPTSNTTSYRNNSNQAAITQPRILNKNASTTSSNAPMQRTRYMGTNQDGQRLPTQQQVLRTPSMTTSGQRISVNSIAQPKATVATSGQRRSEPMPPTASTSSSSIVDNYINTLTHLAGGNTAVSITPAKPKEKAVIDLTDEDEVPTQPPCSQPTTQIPITQVSRRSLPVQNNTNSQMQYGRAAPPLARIPPANQMANNKTRQISSMQAQKTNSSITSISTPPGTSITRINVAPNTTNTQRVKYSHPAPLPATPPQAFNPSWKLPPPRPTIRISNLDNGIVISWTMEESMDRHAECVSYQIYAYQETSGPPMVDSWRHVGDVKAMLLPMAVTLTQFQEGQRYYFAVRAVDCHQRFGPFSLPKTWS